MENDILFNGMLYIKKTPTTIKHPQTGLSESYVDNIIDSINSLEMAPLKQYLKNLRNYYSENDNQYDYSGTNCFYQLFINDRGYSLISSDINSPNRVKTYPNASIIKKDFISFLDFIKEAKYIGRYFRRTKEVNKGNTSFIDNNFETLVLYATDYAMIVKTNFQQPRFEIVSKRYIADGNFEYYGNAEKEYEHPEILFRDIINQIQKENGRGKKSL